MIVCPVCENQQANGFECDVCGHDLSGALGSLGPPPVSVQPMADLEVTVPDKLGDVPVERVGDLEATASAPVGNVAAAPMVELEATGQTGVGEVPVEKMADMAEDRAAFVGTPTQLSAGAVQCRYCGNLQAEGLICDRCGMRLPRASAAQLQPSVKVKVELVRCKFCGAPGQVNARCMECGRLVPAPEP